jgi:integrase
MTAARFRSRFARDFDGFLHFKRGLGYGYRRAEFTLREFDRFLRQARRGAGGARLDRAALEWLGSKPGRKAVSVSMDAAVLRQLFRYLRRLPDYTDLKDPSWPQLPTMSTFVPHVLSANDIKQLLGATAGLERPPFRAALYRCLILMLYCTGIRFGEALRLRLCDVDLRTRVLFIDEFKGRARWVPFHRSLTRELQTYLSRRRAFAPTGPDDRWFVGANRQRLPVSTAWHTFDTLYRRVGLKSARGRVGPRPYDVRHAFAIHRLTRWYRQGVNLHARLPWLSAYMGHGDILGTETYLTATPELLGLAATRFRRQYLRRIGHHRRTHGRTPERPAHRGPELFPHVLAQRPGRQRAHDSGVP